MNTHIIIQIKDIEVKISAYKAKLKACEEGGVTTRNFYRMQGFLAVYEELLNNKQISLDEKDIEDMHNKIENKAIANSRYCKVGEHSHDCGCGDYEEGYKQALKDLL